MYHSKFLQNISCKLATQMVVVVVVVKTEILKKVRRDIGAWKGDMGIVVVGVVVEDRDPLTTLITGHTDSD